MHQTISLRKLILCTFMAFNAGCSGLANSRSTGASLKEIGEQIGPQFQSFASLQPLVEWPLIAIALERSPAGKKAINFPNKKVSNMLQDEKGLFISDPDVLAHIRIEQNYLEQQREMDNYQQELEGDYS